MAGNASEALTVLANGFVGINDATPTERLDIAGAIRVGGASSNFNAGQEGAVLDYSGTAVRVGHANGAAGSAKPIQFLVSGNPVAIIDASGNLGVGNLTPSNYFGAVRTMVIARDQASTTQLFIGNNTTGASVGAAVGFGTATTGSNAFVILSDGAGSPSMNVNLGSGVTSFNVSSTGEKFFPLNPRIHCESLT